jgi:cobalt-zinc-cadmium resistance protein CzcA
MEKLINSIVTFSLKNRIAVIFITFALAVAGVISYKNTPIEAFPDVTNTQITIITQWPGRSAEEIERFVSIPMEITLNAVQRKTSLRSTTLFGLSVIKIIFEDDVEDFVARQQVMNLLGEISLPDGVNPEVQPPYGPTGEIFRYTLKSEKRSVRELKTIQDWVIDRNIRSVEGIADIVSFGGEVKIYEIVVDPRYLTDYDITPLEVFAAVSKSNINVGGDVIEKNDQAYVVRGIGLLTSIPDIENIIVDYINGVPILVKNVARVKESAMPRLGQVGRENENDVVEGIVVMRKGQNPSEVIDRLKAKVVELNEHILPEDVKISTFYNRETLIDYCIDTVSHNLVEGIVLVMIIVSIFLADWRTSFIVSIIIPLSLLFAFICLKMKGMSANLLSIGAVDFGIIIDGAVVMTEGLFVVLDQRAHKLGMERFNKTIKLGLIRKTGFEMGKAMFFAKMIIIGALVPIFTFTKVEGKMFTPLAWTLGFALLGSLLFTLTLVPVLVSYLLNTNVKERHNPLVHFFQHHLMNAFDYVFARKKIAIISVMTFLTLGFYSFHHLGSEFLPQLNEGAIYVRANLPLSISLPEAVKLSNKMRHIMERFPEIKQVMSQTGRPNDGTDPTGFYNVEFHVDLLPKKEWKRKISKEELIEEMKDRLAVYPGILFNFSQPIMDNVEEAVSGVKGSIAVKVFGHDLYAMEKYADQVYNQLKTVEGIEDLGVIRNIGQPELRIEFNEAKMATYGVSMADASAVIEMAIGGKAATQFYEGERKFDVRIRFAHEFRKNEEDIGNRVVPNIKGIKIPIKEIAEIKLITGPLLIFREANKRFIAIKFSVRGRDMGSTIAEAQKKVNAKVKLTKSHTMIWTGDFENQQRAQNHLVKIVPFCLLGIFLLLFSIFGNMKDAGMVMSNVPFAVVGGILALLITGTNFSIAAGIGFIALAGICIQDGVIVRNVFKHNLIVLNMPLAEAIREGIKSRIRPIVMTALMGMLGLFPAAISTGIGSEAQKPLAIVVIGGLITTSILSILIDPVIFYLAYRKKYEPNGPPSTPQSEGLLPEHK